MHNKDCILTRNLTEKLFLLAGLSNILGVLVCSRLFTNQIMMETQPLVMGLFGLIAIVLWGLAYIAVHKTYEHVRFLIGVFVVEKLVYVIVWVNFVMSHSLADIYQADTFAGIFYSVYGINDFLFLLFFAFVFSSTRQVQR